MVQMFCLSILGGFFAINIFEQRTSKEYVFLSQKFIKDPRHFVNRLGDLYCEWVAIESFHFSPALYDWGKNFSCFRQRFVSSLANTMAAGQLSNPSVDKTVLSTSKATG